MTWRVLYPLLLTIAGCASVGTGPAQEPPSNAQAAIAIESAESINHFLTATILRQGGRFEEAIKELRMAADSSQHPESLQVKLIRSYIQMGDLSNATTMCEQALERMPDDPSLWIVMGGLYSQAGKYDEATSAYEKAIQINPDDALGYEALARAERSTNDLVAVVDTYTRLLKLAPNSPMLHYQLGLSLVRINDLTGARDELKKAAELKPEDANALYFLGAISMDLNENQEAIDSFQKVKAIDPDFEGVDEKLAVSYVRVGNNDDAIRLFSAILGRPNPPPVATLQCMYVMLRAGRFREANEIVPPNGAPVLGTLLRALARKNLNEPYRPLIESLDGIEGSLDDELREFLPDVLYLHSKDEPNYYILDSLAALCAEGIKSKRLSFVYARALMSLERHSEAEPVLIAALETFGPERDLHLSLATIYDELKRFEDAERHLKACLELDPSDSEVLNFLGYMYAEKNVKLDEAEGMIQRALEKDPNNGFYLDSLGWVYYRKGDADKAILHIRKAIVTMETDDAVLRNHLGDAYLLKGDIEKAIAEWKRALRLDPKIEGVQEKLKQHEPAASPATT